MSDTATYTSQRVTVQIRLGIPAKSQRNPDRLTDGEQRLQRFVEKLKDLSLIESSEQGDLSADGRSFRFTLRQLPNGDRLASVCGAYLTTTGRQLTIVYESAGYNTPSKRKVAGESFRRFLGPLGRDFGRHFDD